MKTAYGHTFMTTGLLLAAFAVAAQAQVPGGTQLWVKRYNGGDDLGNTLAVDGAGNVFVTGSEATPGKQGCTTVAYSSTGVPLWTNRTSLVSPAIWTTVSPGPVVVNGHNTVTNPISGTRQSCRLSQ